MSRLPIVIRMGAALLAAATFSACGHPEKIVVDKFFQAVNAKDNQTLGSFSLVSFDKKVDKWTIKGSTTESNVPAPLPALVKTQKDVDALIAENRKEYSRYNLDHMNEVDEYKELRKSGSKIPAKLATTASDWEKFEQKEKDLKKQLSIARDAVEKEKRRMMVSIGNVDDIDTLEGEIQSKLLDLELLIEGQPQPYKMTVKKYDVKPASGQGKVISRWVVTGLQKQ